MGIKAIVDDLESVEEGLRGFYKQVGDRYVLDAEGMVPEDDIENHEKTQGLKSALQKERESRREYEKKVKELENKPASKFTDEDVAELESLRDIKRKAEEERRRREGEFDKWRDEINSEHQQTVEQKDAFIQRLQDQIRSDRVGRQIAEACGEHGAPTALMAAYIEKHVKSSFDDEGNLQVSVVDAEGSRMLDAEGKPLGIGGFVKKLADSKDFGQYFASKQKSGAGTPPGDRDGPGSGGKPGEKPSGEQPDPSKMSATERANYERKQKIAAFREQQAAGAGGE